MAETRNEQVPKTGKNSKSVFASRYVSLDMFIIPQKGLSAMKLKMAA